MITRIKGKLCALSETSAYIEVDPFEYEVFIPQFVYRQLTGKLNEEISLTTIEYIDGNPQKGRLVPRLIGFLTDVEKEFFDVFCSVDGVGVKTALKAINRPARDVAIAIEEQNIKELSTLPGIGPSTAERIVAKLRKKMTRFALMVKREDGSNTSAAQSDFLSDAYEALLTLGHTSSEARQRIDNVMEQSGKKLKSVEDVLRAVYELERHD